MEEGEEGEAGPPREEEEEEGVLHQGQGLEEEEEVDPPHPEGEGPQVGVLENPQTLLPGPRPEEGVREVQKAVQVQEAREAEEEGDPQGGGKPRGEGQEGEEGQGEPQEVARQGEEGHAPLEVLLPNPFRGQGQHREEGQGEAEVSEHLKRTEKCPPQVPRKAHLPGPHEGQEAPLQLGKGFFLRLGKGKPSLPDEAGEEGAGAGG